MSRGQRKQQIQELFMKLYKNFRGKLFLAWKKEKEVLEEEEWIPAQSEAPFHSPSFKALEVIYL